MASAGGWELTESDPGIFSAVLWELGVKGLEVEELFGLDGAQLERLKPVFAFIFLFKWQNTETRPPAAGTLQSPSGSHYFALQTINNACATLAILNAVLNIHAPNVEYGEELNNLLAFSHDLDAELKGSVLTNSERIREVHNSFARSNPFALDEFASANEDQDAFHFVSYLPIDGHLYELDGLKPMPVDHGPIQSAGDSWLEKAREVIEARIATYAQGEVHFNLMALVADRVNEIQKRISEQEVILSSSVQVAKDDAGRQLAQLQVDLSDEQAKRSRWAFENAMRRHNHVGLAHALLLGLARAGKLKDHVEVAKTLAKERKVKKANAKS